MAKYFQVDELPYRFPWFGRIPIDTWLPLKQWCYERDKGICHYCQNQFRYDQTHCHHVLELSESGTNHPSNLKTLCIGCHKLRHPFME